MASGPAIDLEIVEVRQIDAGDVQQQLGPAYRIAFRNNSVVDINHTFSVGAMASTSRRLSKEFPMATVQVSGIKAGTTAAVDIRLPLDAVHSNRCVKPIPTVDTSSWEPRAL